MEGKEMRGEREWSVGGEKGVGEVGWGREEVLYWEWRVVGRKRSGERLKKGERGGGERELESVVEFRMEGSRECNGGRVDGGYNMLFQRMTSTPEDNVLVQFQIYSIYLFIISTQNDNIQFKI